MHKYCHYAGESLDWHKQKELQFVRYVHLWGSFAHISKANEGVLQLSVQFASILDFYLFFFFKYTYPSSLLPHLFSADVEMSKKIMKLFLNHHLVWYSDLSQCWIQLALAWWLVSCDGLGDTPHTNSLICQWGWWAPQEGWDGKWSNGFGCLSLISVGLAPQTIFVKHSRICTHVKELKLSSMFSAIYAGEVSL